MTKLVQNNTGVSSKNFFLVVITIIGCLLLLVPVVALTIEALVMHTIATDLTGMAAYIGAVSTVLGMGGFTKVMSERYERHFPNMIPQHHQYENETYSEEENSNDETIANEE